VESILYIFAIDEARELFASSVRARHPFASSFLRRVRPKTKDEKRRVNSPPSRA
jgi:hypothetical protein